MDFDIGARIKELREQKEISTNKLSNMAGLSQSYVRKLEKGANKPTVESLDLLCQALGITLEDFMTYKEKSLLELQAIKIISRMSDSQLEGFCKLMGHEDNIQP